MKMLEEKMIMTISDKINQKISHIENEMEKETEINTLMLSFKTQYDICEKKIKLLENTFNDLNIFLEKYKESNNETVSAIQIVVNRLNIQFEETHDKIKEFSTCIEDKSKKYEELNILVGELESSFNKYTIKVNRDIEKRVSDMDTITTKRIESLHDELRGASFNLMPIINGWQNYVDIHSEKIIFNWGSTVNGSGSMNICLDDVSNVLIYDMLTYRSHIKYITDVGYTLSGPLKMLEQFKKIKSLYFEFTTCDVHGQIRDMIITLFPLLLEVNPIMEIHYKCKDYPSTELIRDAFLKTNKYNSFHLVILNNYTKDASSGNMRFVSNQLWDSIKEHCQKNNINFTSNIGI
jgi:hypothetical protein